MSVAGIAGAADITVLWTNPTTRTDGSALPAAQLRGTRIDYGTCASTSPPAFGSKQGEVLAPAGVTTVIIPDLVPGVYCAVAYARAINPTDSTIQESAASNAATKTIVAAPPSPPTGLTAQSGVAYTVVKQIDRFVLLPVGTIPVGTPCITSQSVNGFYAVPRSAVVWAGSVRPDVVVGQCG